MVDYILIFVISFALGMAGASVVLLFAVGVSVGARDILLRTGRGWANLCCVWSRDRSGGLIFHIHKMGNR